MKYDYNGRDVQNLKNLLDDIGKWKFEETFRKIVLGLKDLHKPIEQANKREVLVTIRPCEFTKGGFNVCENSVFHNGKWCKRAFVTGQGYTNMEIEINFKQQPTHYIENNVYFDILEKLNVSLLKKDRTYIPYEERV